MMTPSGILVSGYIQLRSWGVAYIVLLIFIIRARRCPVVERLLVRYSIAICSIGTFTRGMALSWIDAPQPGNRPADPSLRIGVDPLKLLGRQESWSPPG